MLEKSTVKKLSEHDWLTFVKRDSNPTQTSIRFRKQANKAINDLVLLADKLPDNIQKQIFSYLNIEKFVKSILKESFDIGPDGEARRAHLAALLVKEGIDICARYYKSTIEDNPILNQPLLEQLYRTSNFCEEIAFKVGSRDIYEDRTYLFSLPAEATYDYYHSPHADVQQEEVFNFVRETMRYKSGWKGGTFDAGGGEIYAINGEGRPYIFRLKVNDDKTKAILRIYDEATEDGEDENEEKCVHEQELIVKKEGKLLSDLSTHLKHTKM